MTQMFPKYFGVHQHVIRSGIWVKLRPGEQSLYLFLLERCERLSSREITATNAEITAAVGPGQRTLCNARKKLWTEGLIRYRAGAGNKFTYTICDPETGEPYPGDPKTVVHYQKVSDNGAGRAMGSEPSRAVPTDDRPCGLPLDFNR